MDTFQLSDLQRYLQMAQDWTVTFLPKIILALLILWIGFRIIKKVNQFVEQAFIARKVEPTIRSFFSPLIDIALKFVLFLIIANIFGIETTSFVAIVSAMAFAIGLALQGSLGHFASGILLLVLKPYKVGDEVKVGEVEGFVEEIQIFNTAIHTRDNRIVYVPNGAITSGNIINYSAQDYRRVDLIIVVAEQNNMQRVKKILEEVAESCPYRAKSDEKYKSEVFLYEFDADVMRFAVRVWCLTVRYWEVWSYITEQAKIKFDDNDLSDNITYIKMLN